MTGMLNDVGALWALYFGLAVIQNTVFLALVLVVLYLVRHARASVRYVIGAIGLGKLLLPPFLPAHLLKGLSGSAVVSNLPFVSSEVAATSGVVDRVIAAPPPETLTATGFVFACWAGLALVYVLASAGSSLRLARSLRHATPTTHDSGSRLRVRRSDRIAVPITLWAFPRTIFVPVEWEQWSRESREAVIRHETAHLKRHDGLFQALQMLAQALYFFHPLVFVLGRRLNELREMACDDASVQPGRRSRLEYSRHLAEIAEDVIRKSAVCESASALIRRRSELMARIEYQLRGGTMFALTRGRIIAAVIGLVVFIVPLSWYHSTATPRKTSGHTTIEVSIEATKGGDTIRIDGKKASLKRFAGEMEDAAGSDRDGVIVDLVCDDAVRMGTMFEVQAKLVKLGLLKVRFANLTGKQIPHVLPSPQMVDKMKTIDPKHISNLQITDEGGILVDGKKVDGPRVVETVKKKLVANSLLIVAVEASEESRYEDFVEVLSALREAEANRVMIRNPSASG